MNVGPQFSTAPTVDDLGGPFGYLGAGGALGPYGAYGTGFVGKAQDGSTIWGGEGGWQSGVDFDIHGGASGTGVLDFSTIGKWKDDRVYDFWKWVHDQIQWPTRPPDGGTISGSIAPQSSQQLGKAVHQASKRLVSALSRASQQVVKAADRVGQRISKAVDWIDRKYGDLQAWVGQQVGNATAWVGQQVGDIRNLFGL